jgi:hypothetical protein
VQKILTILFLLTLAQANAQLPTWEWARCPTSGSSNTALGEGIRNATDKAGNNFLVGFYRDTLIFGLDTLIYNHGGLLGTFIAKYNSNGNSVWAKTCSGNSNATGTSVAADANGNVYLGGYFQMAPIVFDTDTLANLGLGATMFLVKYDSLGNVLWSESFGGVGNVTLENLIADGLGNLYAVGSFTTPTVNFDTCVIANTDSTHNTEDFFLVKFDSNGSALWARTGIGIGDESGMAVGVDAASNVYVAGNFTSPKFIFDTDSLTNHNANNKADVFLLKYDTNGNLLWNVSAGGTSQDYAWALAVNPLGEAFITGPFTSSSITFGTSTLTFVGGIYDSYIFKYSPNGIPDWAICESKGMAAGRSIAINECGDVLLVGSMISDTVMFDSILLSVDTPILDGTFILMLNSSGNVLWGTTMQFGGDDYASIACDGFNNAYLGGDVFPPISILGNDTMINAIGETPFVAKLHFSCTVGISEIQNNFEGVLFPNPFADKLYVTVKVNEQTTISLYNFLGQQILQQSFTNSTTINTEHLADGIYFYELRNEKGAIKTGKVVKQ